MHHVSTTEVTFATLSRAQREAVLVVLCGLEEDEMKVVRRVGHGEVTVEWIVGSHHPLLASLPARRSVAGDHDQQRAVNGRSVVLTPSASSGDAVQQHLLRGRSGADPGAASRRGPAARRRSVSPSLSPRRAMPTEQRSVQWAVRLIDEIMSFARRSAVDVNRISSVEEFAHHVVSTRYGVTRSHKALVPQLRSAAHQFADISPLCLLFHTYASKTSDAQTSLGEFLALCRILGVLLPWSTTEAVKTVRAATGIVPPAAAPPPPRYPDASLKHVALRRYVARNDLPVVLRDAVTVVVPKGSLQHQHIRRYVLRWVQRLPPWPPIAFDFDHHVDADVLAMMVLEGTRDAALVGVTEPDWGDALQHSSGDDVSLRMTRDVGESWDDRKHGFPSGDHRQQRLRVVQTPPVAASSYSPRSPRPVNTLSPRSKPEMSPPRRHPLVVSVPQRGSSASPEHILEYFAPRDRRVESTAAPCSASVARAFLRNEQQDRRDLGASPEERAEPEPSSGLLGGMRETLAAIERELRRRRSTTETVGANAAHELLPDRRNASGDVVTVERHVDPLQDELDVAERLLLRQLEDSLASRRGSGAPPPRSGPRAALVSPKRPLEAVAAS